MTNQSQMDFHHGKVLNKIAGTYPSIFETVQEQFQNSVDSNATEVGIVINKKDRFINIVDNGDGASRSKFDEALASVGSSIKKGDKLGQYGLGLVSPIGKCAYSTFTSCPRGSRDGYLEWKFVTEKILAQRDRVHVPVQPRTLVFDPKAGPDEKGKDGVKRVPWRTKVSICGYTKDRKISEIRSAQGLFEALVEKYGVAMRRNNVSVSIQITNEDGTKDNVKGKAKNFSGKRLPEVVIWKRDAGNTRFNLFLARKQKEGYKGQVVVGIADNDYRFPFRHFAQSAGNDLTSGVVELFRSGLFEGEIIVEKAMLNDTRKRLEKNDAYVDFCIAIDQWYEEHGKQHVKEAKEQRQGQRLQELTVESLRNVESLLGDPAFEWFRKDTIGSFAYGNIGAGHADPLVGKVTSPQGYSSVSTAVGKAKRNGTGEGHSGSTPDAERPEHSPFTVAGPKGQDRMKVKGGSRGLQCDHIPMGISSPVARLDASVGVLYFNTEHPDWIAAWNTGDREFIQFQEIATIMALVLHTIPPEYEKVADMLFSDGMKPLAFLLRSSTSFSFRARMKALKKV